MNERWVAGLLGGLMFLGARSGHAAAETAFDRPVAATVNTVYDGTYVFACGADHVMRMRYRGQGGSWSSWTQPPGALPCDSAPTAAPFENSNFHSEIDVYYRTTSNHLAEVDIDSAGVTHVFDLSTRNGFGSITGTPAIAIAYSYQQQETALSVVVKQLTTNLIYTWDWRRYAFTASYPKDWSMHAVTVANGTQATSYGSVFTTYDDGINKYISAKTASNWFTVFQSSTVQQPSFYLTQFGPTDRSGVMAFGPADPTSGALCSILYNDATHRIDWWWLTNQTQHGTISSTIGAGGSLYMKIPGDSGWGRSSSDGSLLKYQMYSPYTVTAVKPGTPVNSGISPMACDGACVSNPYVVHFASTPGTGGQASLWVSDGTSAGTVNTSYPGGILAP